MAKVLRGVGFTVENIWGTVSKRGVAGRVQGNHLGLRVTTDDGVEYFADVGLGDGPYDPIRFEETRAAIEQPPFRYRLLRDDASWTSNHSWTFVHDDDGTFAEVVLEDGPATLQRFRAPALEQIKAGSQAVTLLSLIRRRQHSTLILRGCELRIVGEGKRDACSYEKRAHFFDLLRGEFDLYLGNVSEEEQDELWDQIQVAHRERKANGTAAPPA